MNTLQRLHKKDMSVEEYRQKMELYMMRVGFRGDKNTTITRFLSGLSLHIIDRVEFFYLIEI